MSMQQHWKSVHKQWWKMWKGYFIEGKKPSERLECRYFMIRYPLSTENALFPGITWTDGNPLGIKDGHGKSTWPWMSFGYGAGMSRIGLSRCHVGPEGNLVGL
jgi:hypothetical protein